LLTEIKKQSFEGQNSSKNESEAIEAANKALVTVKKFNTDDEVALECETRVEHLKLLNLNQLSVVKNL